MWEFEVTLFYDYANGLMTCHNLSLLFSNRICRFKNSKIS
jgi:hypothetical protein